LGALQAKNAEHIKNQIMVNLLILIVILKRQGGCSHPFCITLLPFSYPQLSANKTLQVEGLAFI